MADTFAVVLGILALATAVTTLLTALVVMMAAVAFRGKI